MNIRHPGGCAGLNEPPSATVLFGGTNVFSGILMSDNGNTLTIGTDVLRRLPP